jgi:hypothetical protein
MRHSAVRLFAIIPWIAFLAIVIAAYASFAESCAPTANDEDSEKTNTYSPSAKDTADMDIAGKGVPGEPGPGI